MATPELSGVIVRLFANKRFGFVECNGQEFFFHQSALAQRDDFDGLFCGQVVLFTAAPDSGKGPRCASVTP